MELSQILIIVFTGVVAGCTVLYCVLTAWLALETRKMRTAQSEPKVSVQLELNNQYGTGGMQLAIRNEGMGPAEDIRFEFEGDPNYFTANGMRTPIDEVSVIKEGLRYLGPGREFTFILGWLFGEAFERASEQPWTFHIQYKDQTGKSKKDKYVLHLSQFSHLILSSGDPLRGIEKHLGDINKEFRHLGTGFHKPQVITQTKEEFRRELERGRQQRLANKSGSPEDESKVDS